MRRAGFCDATICVMAVPIVKHGTVDLEHGVVDFDYVRREPVVIVSIHALNPERDMHRGCTDRC